MLDLIHQRVKGDLTDTLLNLVLPPSLQVIINSFKIVRFYFTFELKGNGHLELLSTDGASVSKKQAHWEYPFCGTQGHDASQSCDVACYLAPRDSCGSKCMAFSFKWPDEVLSTISNLSGRRLFGINYQASICASSPVHERNQHSVKMELLVLTMPIWYCQYSSLAFDWYWWSRTVCGVVKSQQFSPFSWIDGI